MRIALEQFAGEIPRMSEHLLGDANAQYTMNTNLEKGDVRSWAAPLKITGLTATYDDTGTSYTTGDHVVYGSVLYICTSAISAPAGDFDSTKWTAVTPASLYKFEENSNYHYIVSPENLDYVTSPIASDQYERVYYTGRDEPRVHCNDIVSTPFDPEVDYYKLGVPAPAAACTINAGYSTGSDYRAYVYCYVSEYGEEGPPSAVASVSNYGSGNVTLSGFTANPSGRALESGVIRLYRTNSGSATTAEFQFVKDTNISGFTFATDTITDNVADADLGEVCPSVEWYPPDEDLIGLIGLPNGVFAAFMGNEVHMSEPYIPHAWPYSVSLKHDIIGIGSFGANIVAVTTGNPYIIDCTSPEQTTQVMLPGFYPGLNKQKVLSTPIGVLYRSTEGWIVVNEEGATNLTEKVMTPLDIAPFTATSGFAIYHFGKCLDFYSTTDGAVVVDLKNGFITRISTVAYAGMLEEGSGDLLLLTDDAIDEENPPDNIPVCVKQWEADPYNYQYFKFKTKRFLVPHELNFSCARVLVNTEFYNDITDAMEENNYLATLNAALFLLPLEGDLNGHTLNRFDVNGDTLYDLNSISINADIVFKLYADGELKFEKVVTNGTPFRLPGGFTSKRYDVQIEGYIPVRRVDVATSMSELMQ